MQKGNTGNSLPIWLLHFAFSILHYFETVPQSARFDCVGIILILSERSKSRKPGRATPASPERRRGEMSVRTIAVLVAAAMSCLGIVGDYFLKRASGEERPLATPAFVVGVLLYASTAFAWVYLMRYLKLATIGVIYSVCMILLLTGMGVLFFDETLNRYEVAGIALAIGSILLLSRFG